MCPVPEGCDPRLVRPCIKRLLEKNGYRVPVTVTAFGKLADVPIDMLRGVFSSGIDLILVPCGTSDIIEIIDITESNPPPVNFLVISDPMACPDLTLLLKSMSYNPLQPFPYHLSMETLLGEGGVPTETAESVSWECLVCCAPDPPGRSFDTFEAHLSSEEHHEEVLLMQTRGPTVQPVFTPMVHSLDKINLGDLDLSRLVEAVKVEGRTIVFWDINSCPVPPDCDASMVGPCIKRFLKKEGCSGPLSIIAIGVLTDVPPGTLSEVFSSGITLHNVPYGPSDIEKLIYDFSSCSGPPLNIMVISNFKNFACMPDFIQQRFNILKPFPNHSLERLILADSGYLKEDNCSEYLWFCSLCNDRKFVHATTYLYSFHGSFEPVSSFERFIWHLHGSSHRWKMLELCPLNEQLQRMSEPLSVPREKT